MISAVCAGIMRRARDGLSEKQARNTGVLSYYLVDDINFRASSVGVGEELPSKASSGAATAAPSCCGDPARASSPFHRCSEPQHSHTTSPIAPISLHLPPLWTVEPLSIRPQSVLCPHHEPSLHSRIRHQHLIYHHRRHAQRYGSELGEIPEEVC